MASPLEAIPGTHTGDTRTDRRWLSLHERIAGAVYDLIVERGDTDFSVTEVAARADVAQGTFYNHFSDKEAAIVASVTFDFRVYHDVCLNLITDEMDAVDRWAILMGVSIHRLLLSPTWPRFARVAYQAQHWGGTDSIAPTRSAIREGIAEGSMRVSDVDLAYRLIHHLRLGLAERAAEDTDMGLEQNLQFLMLPGAVMLGIDQTRAGGLAEWLMPYLETVTWPTDTGDAQA